MPSLPGSASTTPTTDAVWAMVGAAVGLFVIWFLLGLVGRSWKPLGLARDGGGGIDLGRLQLLAWISVVLYSFFAVFLLGRFHKADQPLSGIPGNLLLVLLFSGITAAVQQVLPGPVRKEEEGSASPAVTAARLAAPRAAGGLRRALVGVDGALDLGRAQMLLWTALAVVVYLYRLANWLQASTSGQPAMPDLEPVLMALVGLGQLIYLVLEGAGSVREFGAH